MRDDDLGLNSGRISPARSGHATGAGRHGVLCGGFTHRARKTRQLARRCARPAPSSWLWKPGLTSPALLLLLLLQELVAALLAWGRAKGYSFKATTPGRRGLTALHLAALIRDQGVIAGMITEMCDDAVSGWETAAAEDGTTPMAFAQAHGNADIIRHLIAAKQLKKVGGWVCWEGEAVVVPGSRLVIWAEDRAGYSVGAAAWL